MYISMYIMYGFHNYVYVGMYSTVEHWPSSVPQSHRKLSRLVERSTMLCVPL